MPALSILLTAGVGAVAILIAGLIALRSTALWPRKPGKPIKSRRKLIDRTPLAKLSSVARRRVLIGLRIAGALLVVGLLAEGVLLGQALTRLNNGTAALKDAAATLGTNPEAWTASRIATARSLDTDAQAELGSSNRWLHRDPLVYVGRHLPFAGSQVQTMLDLADAEVSGADALTDFLSIASAVDASRTVPDTPGTRVLKLINAAGPAWTRADQKLTPPVSKLDADSQKGLVDPLAGLVKSSLDVLRPVQTQAHVGGLAARYAPAALGADQPRNYLVLLANPSEQRPAGGFYGSLGLITINGGAPSAIEIKSQEAYNAAIKKPTPIPAPLGRYLRFNKNALDIGDSGWDPDFPTTARLAESMYTAATGRAVDGTISIDPYALSAMLAVSGPVDVPTYGQFNSVNFFSKVNFIVNVSTTPGSGKGALGPIGQAVLTKVLNSPAALWPKLILASQQQADSRHILVYFHDPNLANAAAAVHYDGALEQTSTDYLMVADANVGATKGDYYAHKTMEVKTEVNASGITRHEVTLNYDMPSALDETDRKLNPGDGSYRDYLRFYLPDTATVASLSTTMDGQGGGAALDNMTYEHGRSVAAVYIKIPRGHSGQVKLTYQVATGRGSTYDFLVQKQAGLDTLPTKFLVNYPGGNMERDSDLTHDMRLGANW